MPITDNPLQKLTPILNNGLAVYSLGNGPTTLLMPYPHGFPIKSTAESELAHIVLELGQRVVTFDPPGAFRSTRPAQVSMSEMLDGAEATLHTFDVNGPLTVVGHSMGGLSAIAYVLAYPGRVKQLVLIGSVSGGPAIVRGKGMPWGLRRTDLDFWRFAFWGMQLSAGKGNLAVHKKLLRLLWRHSYVDKNLIPHLEITAQDRHLPAPIRDRWPQVARQLDYSGHLKEIGIPTLVCAGRFDPQAPVACSEELAQTIPAASLVIFEQSGHYPFLEERLGFTQVLAEFLSASGRGAN